MSDLSESALPALASFWPTLTAWKFVPKIAGADCFWVRGAVIAVDPVQHRLHFHRVIGADAGIAGGVVVASLGTLIERILRVDLRRIKFVEASARRARHILVGRMLVRPDRTPSGSLDDFENRVGSHIVMRKDGDALAVDQLALHVVGIELRVDLTHCATSGKVGHQRGRVIVALIERLEVGEFGSWVAHATRVRKTL